VNSSRKNKGFTLVERAVGMTVIGRAIGGTLKGAEMIDNARRNATIQDITDFERP
jgi:hypothetical protein